MGNRMPMRYAGFFESDLGKEENPTAVTSPAVLLLILHLKTSNPLAWIWIKHCLWSVKQLVIATNRADYPRPQQWHSGMYLRRLEIAFDDLSLPYLR